MPKSSVRECVTMAVLSVVALSAWDGSQLTYAKSTDCGVVEDYDAGDARPQRQRVRR